MSATKGMLSGLALAAGLFILPASAADVFDALAPLAAEDLDGRRGRQEATQDLIMQNNETNQVANNDVAISMHGPATKINGAISAATVTGNHGVTSLMQNTGDGVNMQNATNVNVYMR